MQMVSPYFAQLGYKSKTTFKKVTNNSVTHCVFLHSSSFSFLGNGRHFIVVSIIICGFSSKEQLLS